MDYGIIWMLLKTNIFFVFVLQVAKRNFSLESHHNDIDSTAVYENPKEHNVTIPESAVSSSAESLREIENPEQVPRINIQTPSDITRPSTSDQTQDVRTAPRDNLDDAVVSHSNQSQPDVSQTHAANSKDSASKQLPLATDIHSSIGVSPSDKNNQKELSNKEISDSEGEELMPINTTYPSLQPTREEINNMKDENDISNKVSKKRKTKGKKLRSSMQEKELVEMKSETRTRISEVNELPPLVPRGRRPLPSLDSYTNETSPC